MTRRGFADLRQYQHLLHAFQCERRRWNGFAGMGLGKTVTTLTYIDTLYETGRLSGRVLIPAPKRVALNTWPDEVAKWSHLRNIDIRAVVGTETERLAALASPANVLTINFENLQWLKETWRDRDAPFEMIVTDESTRLKSYRGSIRTESAGRPCAPYLHPGAGSGKWAHAIAAWAHRAKYYGNLTGTPAPNGLLDLWAQCWFIDQGQKLGRSFDAFRRRWFSNVGSREAPVYIPQRHAEAEIMHEIGDYTMSLRAEDWFDLRKPVESTIFVELPDKARAAYRSMERELFANIDGTEIEAVNAGVKSQKLLQLANGAFYLDPDAPVSAEDGADATPGVRPWKALHDVKIQALESIINESGGEPVLVAYHFKTDLVRLMKAFPRARVLDDNPATIREWNAGKIPLLFAHPMSAGHGLNLQDGGRRLVYFSVNWNAEAHSQIFERVGPVRQLQSGHDRVVFVHYILARDTVDEDVLAVLQGKATVEGALMAGLARRRAQTVV